VNGTLLDSKDVKGLADAMIRMRENRSANQAMGERNTALVNEKYTIKQMCRQYEALFDEIYKQKAGP
jgi:glycosyltransferase involved in cell wall biosynthesis